MTRGTLLAGREAASTAQDRSGTSLHDLRDLMIPVGLSDDAREDIAAFLDTRAREWKGH